MASAGRAAIVPQDSYDGSKNYKRLDLVAYEGALYVAKEDVAGVLPTDATKWMLAGNFAAQIMTLLRNGIGRPDGTTITVNADGIFSVNGDVGGGAKFEFADATPTVDTAEDNVIYLVKVEGATGENKFIQYVKLHDDTEDVDKIYNINGYDMDWADYLTKTQYNQDMGAIALPTVNKTIKGAIREIYDGIGEETLETTAETVKGAINEVYDAISVLSSLSVVDGALCVTYNS